MTKCMSPKCDSATAVDELISALSDKRVIEAIAGILDEKLNIMMQTDVDLTDKNRRITDDIVTNIYFQNSLALIQLYAVPERRIGDGCMRTS